MRKLMVLFFAGIVVLSSANVYAKSGHSREKGFEKKVFSMLKTIYMNQEELGVTDEQLDKLKELKLSLKKDLIKNKAEIDIIMVDMHALLWEDEIDTKKINELIDAKYDFKKKKAKTALASYADLKEQLSAEQEDKLKALMKENMKSKKAQCPVQK